MSRHKATKERLVPEASKNPYMPDRLVFTTSDGKEITMPYDEPFLGRACPAQDLDGNPVWNVSLVDGSKTRLPVGSKERKEVPMASGCLDYFPDALAYVARISYAGNQKHNPGQPLHHNRSKSGDHADCIMRHLLERGTVDAEDNLRHSGKLAWRALALLQEELEQAHGLPLPRGATEK